ncbi:MAG: SPOR domain-containing protein [Sphingomicrobium sp.]
MPLFGSRYSLLLACALTGLASPVAAQYGRAPQPAQVSGFVERPADALVRHLRQLAVSPRDFTALVGAGRAALELGDTQAAAGFFGRAEEVQPRAPQPKVGLGAAMVQMSDAQGAMRYFAQAARLGATPTSMALDRGMARDLLGDLGGAQSDYRLALFGSSSDEARRRLALSLAIARDRKGALDAIQPLLNRRDTGAQRVRAFVLALTGDRGGATQAIETVMPGAGARFDPFFRYLPNLSIAEKAAAVHLGLFPEDAATRVAQAAPPPAPRPTFTTTARAAAKPPSAPPVKVARRDPVVTVPPAASPSFSLPSAKSAEPTAPAPAPTIATVAQPVAPAPRSLPAPAFSIADATPAAGEARLSGIDKLLATIAEASPPSPPKVEAPAVSAKATREAKTATARKAAEKKARDEKLAAEKKAREEAAKLGVAGTNWIQLAGGSNQDRMASEYKKLVAKAGSVLKRPAYITGGKDYFRLLVGPFDSKSDAQAFVNKLAKEGVDGFSWTRNPAHIRIEKLRAK